MSDSACSIDLEGSLLWELGNLLHYCSPAIHKRTVPLPHYCGIDNLLVVHQWPSVYPNLISELMASCVSVLRDYIET